MNNPHSVYVLASITELGGGSVEDRGAFIARRSSQFPIVSEAVPRFQVFFSKCFA